MQPQPAAPPDRRLGGSLAVALMGAQAGAAILRVHDVAAAWQSVEVLWTLDRERGIHPAPSA